MTIVSLIEHNTSSPTSLRQVLNEILISIGEVLSRIIMMTSKEGREEGREEGRKEIDVSIRSRGKAIKIKIICHCVGALFEQMDIIPIGSKNDSKFYRRRSKTIASIFRFPITLRDTKFFH